MIEDIIEHEVIHITIAELESEEVSTAYDNIFSDTEGLREFMNE